MSGHFERLISDLQILNKLDVNLEIEMSRDHVDNAFSLRCCYAPWTIGFDINSKSATNSAAREAAHCEWSIPYYVHGLNNLILKELDIQFKLYFTTWDEQNFRGNRSDRAWRIGHPLDRVQSVRFGYETPPRHVPSTWISVTTSSFPLELATRGHSLRTRPYVSTR
jgi:hypothetical protein